jgi:hypothetical protein
MERLADSLPRIDATPEGRAALREWIEEFSALYERYGAVIRAWTEAEISSSELGRVGEGVLGGFSVAVARRLQAAAGEGFDPPIAALAVVAMLERLNYYVVTRAVEIDRDTMIDTLTDVTLRALSPR